MRLSRPTALLPALVAVVIALPLAGPATAERGEGRGAARAESRAESRADHRDDPVGIDRGSRLDRVARTAPATFHQMPFPCGETWTGATRRGHSPGYYSVDFNRNPDQGAPVVASAAGTVITAQATSRGGYGRYVVIDHGNDESSLYAHLDSVAVVAGQWVDQGTLVGAVGNSGNSYGSHLHFEERVGRTIVAPWFNGAPFAWGAQVSANCPAVPLAANFSGDAIAELVVFRRGPQTTFEVQDGVARSLAFGKATDEPIVGDWDGDGYANPGVRNQKRSMFKLQTGTGAIKFRYGRPGDRPVAGDWDGNGIADVGVRRPTEAVFYLRSAAVATTVVPLGDADDIPVTGDWNGDRRTDVGVYDRATAVFTTRVVDAAGVVTVQSVAFGAPGDLPVVGDWNGNGITDLGVWRPAEGMLYPRVGRPVAGAPARELAARRVAAPR